MTEQQLIKRLLSANKKVDFITLDAYIKKNPTKVTRAIRIVLDGYELLRQKYQ